MSMEFNVFVVQVETTGLWEADCCNTLCGHGLHTVAEGLTSRALANGAATLHRKQVCRLLAEQEDRGARLASRDDSTALEVVRMRGRLRRVEEELKEYRRRFGPLPEEEL